MYTDLSEFYVFSQPKSSLLNIEDRGLVDRVANSQSKGPEFESVLELFLIFFSGQNQIVIFHVFFWTEKIFMDRKKQLLDRFFLVELEFFAGLYSDQNIFIIKIFMGQQ